MEFQGLSAACCRQPSGTEGAVFWRRRRQKWRSWWQSSAVCADYECVGHFYPLGLCFYWLDWAPHIGPGRTGQASRQLWPNKSVQLSAVPQFSSPQANAVSHQPFPPQVSTARLSQTQPSPAQHSLVHLTAASHFGSARVGLPPPLGEGRTPKNVTAKEKLPVCSRGWVGPGSPARTPTHPPRPTRLKS